MEVETVDENDLALRASEDLDAFAELYRRYLCRVHGWIRTQVPSEAIAEDLTAQVFFRALASADSFRGQGSYSSWIYSIARNLVTSWRRRRWVLVGSEVPEAEDPGPGPATLVIGSEQRAAVRATIKRLSPAQREVVTLRYLRELSISEVADVTGRSTGAVRILLHRARLALRKRLEDKDLH